MVEDSAFAVVVAVAGTLFVGTSVGASVVAEADFASIAFEEMAVELSQSAELGVPWALEVLLLLLMTALVGL